MKMNARSHGPQGTGCAETRPTATRDRFGADEVHPDARTLGALRMKTESGVPKNDVTPTRGPTQRFRSRPDQTPLKGIRPSISRQVGEETEAPSRSLRPRRSASEWELNSVQGDTGSLLSNASCC